MFLRSLLLVFVVLLWSCAQEDTSFKDKHHAYFCFIDFSAQTAIQVTKDSIDEDCLYRGHADESSDFFEVIYSQESDNVAPVEFLPNFVRAVVYHDKYGIAYIDQNKLILSDGNLRQLNDEDFSLIESNFRRYSNYHRLH